MRIAQNPGLKLWDVSLFTYPMIPRIKFDKYPKTVIAHEESAWSINNREEKTLLRSMKSLILTSK